MNYRPDIDGLRTLAVVLVLVFHFDLFELGKAGFIGVDIFFVISGFLITGIIRRDLSKGQFRFVDFLYRRMRRLYPALLATLFLTNLAGWFLFLPHRMEDLAQQTLWSMLYVVNFYFWQNLNYFGLQAGTAPLLHLWSLAIEEQFYVAFPLACIGIWRWAPRLLIPAVSLGALISFVLGIGLSPIKPELAFYLLPTRAWELLVGSLLAFAVYERKLRGDWLNFMGIAGLVLVGVSVATYGPLIFVPGYFSLLPTLGTAALILGGYATEAPVTRIMSSGPLVWIGKLSYPLYLVHWPILIFLKEHTEDFSFGWRLSGFLLSFFIATIVYYFVETPIRNGRIVADKKVYLGLTAALSASMIGASWLVVSSEGVPGRFPQSAQDYLAFKDDTPKRFEACELATKSFDQLCRLGDVSTSSEVIVIGDSHAQALAGAIDIWLKSQKRGGILVFNSGCMPVLGFGSASCEKATLRALELAGESPDVRDVILVSIWRQGLPEGGRQVRGRWVTEEEVPRVFADSIEETVTFLESAGKHITIVEPFFAAAHPVPDTLANNIVFGRNWPIDITLAEHRKTFAPVFSGFDRARSATRISLIEPFCVSGRCRALFDGRPLFTDNNHLAQTHSAIIAKVFSDQSSLSKVRTD